MSANHIAVVSLLYFAIILATAAWSVDNSWGEDLPTQESRVVATILRSVLWLPFLLFLIVRGLPAGLRFLGRGCATLWDLLRPTWSRRAAKLPRARVVK